MMYIYIYPGDLSGTLLESVMESVWEAKHQIVENPFLASYGIRTPNQEKMSCFMAKQDIVLKNPKEVDTVFAESICVDIGDLTIIGTRQSLGQWLFKANDFLASQL